MPVPLKSNFIFSGHDGIGSATRQRTRQLASCSISGSVIWPTCYLACMLSGWLVNLPADYLGSRSTCRPFNLASWFAGWPVSGLLLDQKAT